MSNIDLLDKIRENWMFRVSHLLAPGEWVRESFEKELNIFFDSFKQSVETGNPTLLVPILEQWAEARTESELESSDASLYPLLNQILLLTYDVSRDVLTPEECLNITSALLPVYTFAFGYTITRETQLHISHITAELKHAQSELERIDKSKSDFISIAAHELKTPLSLIEGYTSILRESSIPRSEKPQEAILLKGIDNGTKRLQELFDDMIDVSLIDNNMLSIKYQPVWLNRTLD